MFFLPFNLFAEGSVLAGDIAAGTAEKVFSGKEVLTGIACNSSVLVIAGYRRITWKKAAQEYHQPE